MIIDRVYCDIFVGGMGRGGRRENVNFYCILFDGNAD